MLLLLVLIGVERAIFFDRLMRAVRRAEPDHRQERLRGFGMLANEFDSCVHRHHRAFALGLDGDTFPAEDRVVVEEVRSREPFVEAAGARVDRAAFADRAQMPFSEMPRDIARLLKGFGYSDLLRAKRVAPFEASEAVRVTPGHDAAASRRTDRRRGVEVIEAQRVGGHRVEVRGLQNRVAVIGHITPALVVGHA